MLKAAMLGAVIVLAIDTPMAGAQLASGHLILRPNRTTSIIHVFSKDSAAFGIGSEAPRVRSDTVTLTDSQIVSFAIAAGRSVKFAVHTPPEFPVAVLALDERNRATWSSFTTHDFSIGDKGVSLTWTPASPRK